MLQLFSVFTSIVHEIRAVHAFKKPPQKELFFSSRCKEERKASRSHRTVEWSGSPLGGTLGVNPSTARFSTFHKDPLAW
jgi:hypothetical protein